MIMGRTYSVAAEKPNRRKRPNSVAGQYVHSSRRKTVCRYSVKNGEMDLASARLINIGVVDDNGGAAPHDEGEKSRPVGKQLMSPDTKVGNVKLNIAKLTLPNMKLAKPVAVVWKHRSTLDGKPIQTKIDSTFSRFIPPNRTAATRPFMADARFY